MKMTGMGMEGVEGMGIMIMGRALGENDENGDNSRILE
jgi:hypothetical protein